MDCISKAVTFGDRVRVLELCGLLKIVCSESGISIDKYLSGQRM